jgi:hypothetical protein
VRGCPKWLAAELSDGPRADPDVAHLAEAVDLTDKDRRAACARLRVQSPRKGFAPGLVCLLVLSR